LLLCALQGGSGGVEGWQDVGGLADVRAALQEALELPTKYASLISRLLLVFARHLVHQRLTSSCNQLPVLQYSSTASVAVEAL